jgi:hypothetical protein
MVGYVLLYLGDVSLRCSPRMRRSICIVWWEMAWVRDAKECVRWVGGLLIGKLVVNWSA